jgi:anti-anti-sigma factor
MELTEEDAADVTIVAVSGRLDSQTARQFSNRLGELVGGGQSHLLIETSQLNYIGSAGLRALLLGARQAAEHGGWLALCNLNGPVQGMVETAGLAAVFKTYPTREAALAALADG